MSSKFSAFTRSAINVGLFLLIGLFAPNGAQCDSPPPQSAGFHGDVSLRLREELLDWFAPAPKPGTSVADHTDDFFHLKLQAGLRYEQKEFTTGIQLQYFQLFGLENGTLGPGGLYYSTNGDDTPGDISVRQAYFTWNPGEDIPLGFTAGRFLYANGGEVKSADPDLQSLKQKRLLNRVLGSFDFTGGRSFDGALLRAPFNGQMLTGSYFRPTQGGFATDAMAEITDIQFTTLAYTTAFSFDHPNEFQLFHYYFADTRDDGVVKTDNRDLAVRKADNLGIRIHNFGLSSLHVIKTDALTYDGLLWGILQVGSWGEQDHHSGAFAVEGGARLQEVPWHPRLGFGFDWGRGDSDPTDSDHTTFFQMLPTARQYAFLPFYNSMNNQDLFAQLSARPRSIVEVTAGLHFLWLETPHDLLYSGGGANKSNDQFGFSGTQLAGSRDIGTLADLAVDVQILPYWSISGYYGHLAGGNGFDGFHDRNIDYGFIESNFKFSQ